MARSDLKLLIPPWSLAGIALLFWGVASGKLLVAVLLVLVLEGRRWIPLKWDFDEEAQVKSFYFSVLLIAAGVVLSWVVDEDGSASFNVLGWMPVLFLPLEFAQRYGKRDFVTLNTFFYFTKRRLDLDRKEGREVDPIEINTGYPYILLTIVSACCVDKGVTELWWALCAMVFLVLASIARMRGMSLWPLCVMMPAVVALGWGGQWSLDSAHKWVERYLENRFRHLVDASSQSSSYMSQVGELGNVRLSQRIEWRVWSENQPTYLRMGSYNNYNQLRWTYSFPQEGFSGWNDSFTEHASYKLNTVRGETTYFRAQDKENVARLVSEDAVEVRGSVMHQDPTAVVPTIDRFMAISDMPGDVTYPQINSMGTMRLVERAQVISYHIFPDPNKVPQDKLPVPEIDLKIPEAEKRVLSELVDTLGLRELESERDKVAAIIAYFSSEFEYSVEFDPVAYDYKRTKLEWFLEQVKCGHCEYFATATTLLLRECGIPARYTTGYAVTEKSGDRWLVRGTNAHAWTRAFIDGEWQNVDATPPDLRGSVSHDPNIVDWLRDRIRMVREDVFIWRQDPENQKKLVQRMALVAVAVVLWIIFRLWQHRAKRDTVEAIASSWQGEEVSTPLHKLEHDLKRCVGPRVAGETFAQWLARAAELENVDAELVAQAVRSHQRMRFDPQHTEDANALKAVAKKLKQQLRKQ